jgi:hypothetical protein
MVLDMARQGAACEITDADADAALAQTRIREGGDPDLLQATQARFEKRLGDLTFRVRHGLQDAPLAGRRTDGARVEAKHYAEERRLPVDPKTGEQRLSTPIGSYDFCPTPDKSVSVAWAFAAPGLLRAGTLLAVDLSALPKQNLRRLLLIGYLVDKV